MYYKFRSMFIGIIFLLVVKVIASSHCPAGCNCFQSKIQCVRARLTSIPPFPQDSEALDLRFNLFVEIPRNAFKGLSQVTLMLLNENEIAYLQDGALDDLTNLKVLYLNNNRISKLPVNLFHKLKNLDTLYLHNNEIWQIDANTFTNLPHLSRLFLSNNKISNIPPEVFSRLPNLRRLNLDDNPISCDCGIYSLWQYHQQHSNSESFYINLKCETPSALYRRSFTQLKKKDFHCRKPEIIKAPHDMHLAVGEVVELPCQMAGDPQPEIIWMQNTKEISKWDLPILEILPSGNLRLNPVDLTHIGIYECIGRNEVGETRSQPIRINIENQSNKNLKHNAAFNSVDFDINQDGKAPYFIRTTKDKTVALNGDAVVLDCVVGGSPIPEIQWYFNGRIVTQSTGSMYLESNGSLVVTEPSLMAAGVYRCEASNPLGSIQSDARIDVKEFPQILLAPQSQTVKVDKPLVLECDADGNPLPTISWIFNGAPVIPTEHILLENENTELIINKARESDAGIYSCVADNANGQVTAAATVKVERSRGPPRLLIEPYDLEAIAGTTIELPCKALDSDGLLISWRRDGRVIDPNVFLTDKYEISGTGSLFVKNVTVLDNGRYECSLKNEFGRATASALVTIKSNVDLAPGDRYVRVAFEEAAKEIDLAINNTIDILFNNRSRTYSNGAKGPPNYGDLLRVFRFPTGEARQLARAAEIYERTLVNIRKHVQKGDNLSIESDKFEFRDLLSREHLHLVAELSGCQEHREMPNCTDMCYHSKYRSIDGTCNNLQHPTWGASLTSFRRISKPIYENGFSMPVGWMKNKLYSGFPKPSSRLISTTLISTKEITPDSFITHMVMQWGQFLDHDLDHAIPSVSSESWDGVDCKKTCDFSPPCYPIVVPPNDPRVKNRRCIDVVRSSSICGSGMTSVFFDSIQHREQINQLTSFIDASQVYGYSYPFSQELRNLTTDDGLLRVGVNFPNQKDMLPFSAPQDGMDCRRNLDENTMSCFTAGDIRVNEQIGLLAMHTIWMREHNRIATKLKDINPHWDGDTLYQEARKIVGAQMQHITYKLWLPLIIGQNGMEKLGEYRGYDPNINPTIANEFATAALRFGHTIINPVLHRLDSKFQPIPQGHLQLHKAFFAPWRLAYEGGVDPLMRGMFAVPAKLKTPDQNLNTELTEKLFHTAHAVALDLAAINIQRGRDHGIPGYNVYREFCNLSVAKTFEDLSNEISNPTIRSKLQELYGHPDNIDVWVGGVLEDQVDGGKVGPLFQCLLIEQFRRLRDGDRFYYENPSVFMPEQLQEIKQASLARVLCDVGDNIEEITENVFLLPKRQNGYKKCEDINGINLYFWQDCGTCNSLPPLLSSYVPQTYVKRSHSKRSIPDIDTHTGMNNDLLENMLDVNEERISGLEDVINSLQKEQKKLLKKMRKLQEAYDTLSTEKDINVDDVIIKPKRHHCIDQDSNKRINNEVWSADNCTRCECRHGQITCTHEKCGEVSCKNGVEPITSSKACCPHCPKHYEDLN